MPGINLLGNCSTCCTCPSPFLASVTRSASKSKSTCSFSNPLDGKYYTNYSYQLTSNGSCVVSSSPPPFGSIEGGASWNEVTIVSATASCSGTFSNCSFTASSNENMFQISNIGNQPPGTVENGEGYTYVAYANDVGTGINAGIACNVVNCTNPPDYSCEKSFWQAYDYAGIPPHPPLVPENNFTWPYYMRDYDRKLGFSCTSSTTTGTNYSNEYTSNQLVSYTVQSLPNWGNFNTGAASCIQLASSELTMSGNSYSVEQGQYQFLFPVPPTMKYQIKWSVVFIPDSGIASVISTQQFNWNGPAPMGYNPTKESTWPSTPIYMVNQPSSNGIIKLSGISYICGPNFSGVVC